MLIHKPLYICFCTAAQHSMKLTLEWLEACIAYIKATSLVSFFSGAAVLVAGLLRAWGMLAGWGLKPAVVVASVRSGLRTLGSFGWCLVCGARWWISDSVACSIFGLKGFPLGSSLKTEGSATSYLSIFRVGLSKRFVNHGSTPWQVRPQAS